MADTDNPVRDSLLSLGIEAERAGLPHMLVGGTPCSNQWMDDTAARTRAFFRNPPPREPDRSPRERFVLD